MVRDLYEKQNISHFYYSFFSFGCSVFISAIKKKENNSIEKFSLDIVGWQHRFFCMKSNSIDLDWCGVIVVVERNKKSWITSTWTSVSLFIDFSLALSLKKPINYGPYHVLTHFNRSSMLIFYSLSYLTTKKKCLMLLNYFLYFKQSNVWASSPQQFIFDSIFGDSMGRCAHNSNEMMREYIKMCESNWMK